MVKNEVENYGFKFNIWVGMNEIFLRNEEKCVL